MRTRHARFLVFVLVTLLPSSLFAETNDNAKILIHLVTPTSKNPCARTEASPACAGIVTKAPLYPATRFGYVLVADGNRTAGISGAQFGIEYDGAPQSGVDVYSWTLCADSEYPVSGWPSSGTGNLVAWGAACQTFEPGGSGSGVVAVLGYFYTGAYSAGDLRIVPRQLDGAAKVAACSGAESELGGGSQGALGYASFSASGTVSGYNPCGLTTALPTCSISGPGTMQSGTSTTYAAGSPSAGAVFAWLISGNGSIAGSTTGSSVVVTAGDPGGFSLNVNVTAAGRTGTCQVSVNVVPAEPEPPCAISGPSPVAPVFEYLYSVDVTDAAATGIEWLVTGSATLMSSSGTTATVYAHSTGSFTVTVNVIFGDGMVRACSKSVNISNPNTYADIIGPGLLSSGALAVYTLTGYPGVTFGWTIFGNGTIVGPTHGTSITVRAGSLGAFVLRTGPGDFRELTKVVEVFQYVPQPALNSQAKILVHLTEPIYPSGCDDSRGRPACADVNSDGLLAPHNYFAYVLAADCFTDGTLNSGLSRIQFGIGYNDAGHAGVDILSWQACGTAESPMQGWPHSGTGNVVSWNGEEACQTQEPGGPGTGVVAPAGYFYLSATSPDELRIRPHPGATASVTDCRGVTTTLEYEGQPRVPSPLGFASFSAGGTNPGHAPCGPQAIPVESTTWGGIKALFRDR